MNRPLSTDEAARQAATLRKQGIAFPKIAEHLAKLGYVSPKTKTPVKEQAVRNMVGRFEQVGGRHSPDFEEAAVAEVRVRGPNMEIIEALRLLPKLGLSPTLSLKIVNTLLESL